MLILPVALLWSILYLAFGSPVGYVPLIYFAVLLGAVLVFARTRRSPSCSSSPRSRILLAPTLSMIPLGGFIDSGGVGLWGILAPLGALVFSGVRTAVRWYVAWLVVFLGSGITGELLGGVEPEVPEWFTSTMLALNITVGGTIVFTLLASFAAQRRAALAALREEQARAENLLLNVLPRSIADQLKAQPQTIADQFSSASILFADVVDFTPLAERLPAAEVVGVLDHLFSHFDTWPSGTTSRRSRRSVTATWSRRASRHHARIMRRRSPRWHSTCRPRWARSTSSGSSDCELRIGINSGPVVAGVIGRKRFLYDLWGDAVNTASRMESHGTAGRIQVTLATKELIEDEFIVEPRGSDPDQGQGRDGGVVPRRPPGAPRHGVAAAAGGTAGGPWPPLRRGGRLTATFVRGGRPGDRGRSPRCDS